jgi:mannosidase alpha-like ER degradation enhancer 2
VWKQYGFTPEYYNIPKNEAHKGREGYPLRPGMELFKEYLKQVICMIFCFNLI